MPKLESTNFTQYDKVNSNIYDVFKYVFVINLISLIEFCIRFPFKEYFKNQMH